MWFTRESWSEFCWYSHLWTLLNKALLHWKDKIKKMKKWWLDPQKVNGFSGGPHCFSCSVLSPRVLLIDCVTIGALFAIFRPTFITCTPPYFIPNHFPLSNYPFSTFQLFSSSFKNLDHLFHFSYLLNINN